MKTYKVLLIEDEARMRRLISDYLIKEGYTILQAEDGKKGLELFTSEVDLIILDIMLPKYDGWTVCREIRKKSLVPIIMLTARSEESDELFGFDLGADEYITKPFSPKILVARVKALLKRYENSAGKPKCNSGIQIDNNAHKVYNENFEIDLTPKEYDLLNYLLSNEGIALSREVILDSVWGYDYYGDYRTVDTHVKRLRVKLKDKGDLISTVRGVGYRFEVKK